MQIFIAASFTIAQNGKNLNIQPQMCEQIKWDDSPTLKYYSAMKKEQGVSACNNIDVSQKHYINTKIMHSVNSFFIKF